MNDVTIVLRSLHPGQARMVESQRRFNVAMCGRRTGKTALGTDIACNDALDGKMVGWFAPTYKLLDEAWREMRDTLAGIPGVRANQQQMRIELPTGGVIEGWSLEGGEDVARGRKYHRAIVDEAGLVPNLLRIWMAAIRPTLADYTGGAWFLGTPKGIGDFATLFDWGQDPDKHEWASWRLSTHDNPFIAATEIDAMRAEMPEAIYRQEVLGEPIDDADHPIGLQAIQGCIGDLSERPPVIFGVDLARSVDYTVVVGLDEYGHVCYLDRFQAPWGVARGRIKQAIGTTWTKADSSGVGDPIVEDLQRDGCKVSGVTFTSRVKQAAVETLITAIQQKWITYPDGHIVAELRSLTAERMAYGIRYNALEGRHDDCVIALALAVEGWRDMGYVPPRKQDTAWSQDSSRIAWTTGREPQPIAVKRAGPAHLPRLRVQRKHGHSPTI